MASRFGEMLLNRRRELGMSIQQVANVIKIRPQIIEFFETGNFASMPPRGYAQGMIASYARYLGLNPREVVNAYFDELYVFERSGSAAGSRFTEGATDPVPRSMSTSGRYLMVDPAPPSSRFAQRPPQAGYVSDSSSGHVPMRVAGNERRAANLPPAGGQRRSLRPAEGYRQRPEGAGAPRSGDGRTLLMRRPAGGGYPERRQRPGSAGSGYADRRARPGSVGRGRGSSAGYRAGSSPRRAGAVSGMLGDPRMMLVALAVIALLLVIVVFLLVRSCSAPASSGTDAVQSAQVSSGSSDSGSSSSDSSDDASSSDSSASDAAGSSTGSSSASGSSSTDASGTSADDDEATQTVVRVTLDEGKSSWIEIRVDGEYVYQGQTAGPFEQEFTPTQSVEITVDHPNDVSVLENGESVDWDTKTSGVGRVTITVPQTASASGQQDASDGTDSTDTSLSAQSSDGSSSDE